jgi:hypothetical protein
MAICFAAILVAFHSPGWVRSMARFCPVFVSQLTRMTTSLIAPGFLALHSHRSEVLAETLSAWLIRQPLAALEQEVVVPMVQ